MANFIKLHIKLEDDSFPMGYQKCCDWIKEQSGINNDFIVRILKVEVNLEYQKQIILVSFTEDINCLEVLKQIKNREIRGVLHNSVMGPVNDVKLGEITDAETSRGKFMRIYLEKSTCPITVYKKENFDSRLSKLAANLKYYYDFGDERSLYIIFTPHDSPLWNGDTTFLLDSTKDQNMHCLVENHCFPIEEFDDIDSALLKSVWCKYA